MRGWISLPYLFYSKPYKPPPHNSFFFPLIKLFFVVSVFVCRGAARRSLGTQPRFPAENMAEQEGWVMVVVVVG